MGTMFRLSFHLHETTKLLPVGSRMQKVEQFVRRQAQQLLNTLFAFSYFDPLGDAKPIELHRMVDERILGFEVAKPAFSRLQANANLASAAIVAGHDHPQHFRREVLVLLGKLWIADVLKESSGDRSSGVNTPRSF